MNAHPAVRQGFYRRRGKRAFDVVIAGTAITVTLPIQLVVAMLVRTKLGSPVVFKHERPGLGGQPFTLVKFRSMTDERDAHGNLLPDEVRLTKFGQMLRSTSLDELPELLNVLKGEMSLVGPRPLIMRYLPRYSPEQARRHDVLPGITGWAQVNGRNDQSWDDKLAKDIWYVDNLSFGLDLRILVMTVSSVFLRHGIATEGHVTSPEFFGSSGGEPDSSRVATAPDDPAIEPAGSAAGLP